MIDLKTLFATTALVAGLAFVTPAAVMAEEKADAQAEEKADAQADEKTDAQADEKTDADSSGDDAGDE